MAKKRRKCPQALLYLGFKWERSMTPDDKVTISLFITFLALLATVFQPVINIYASRLINPTPGELARRTARRHALRRALLKLLGSMWFLPALGMLANVASLCYQLTRTGPVTRLTILEISATVASVFFSLTVVLMFPLLNKMADTTGSHVEFTARVGDVALRAHERLDRLDQPNS
jgi:hypothetical protein